MCVQRPKTSSVQEYEILMKWIQCLLNNVVDRLFVATSQSIIDPEVQIFASRYQSTGSYTLKTKRANFDHVTVRFQEINVRALELNNSPKFSLMKQFVRNKNSTQPTMSSSSRKINNCFWDTEIIKWMVND